MPEFLQNLQKQSLDWHLCDYSVKKKNKKFCWKPMREENSIIWYQHLGCRILSLKSVRSEPQNPLVPLQKYKGIQGSVISTISQFAGSRILIKWFESSFNSSSANTSEWLLLQLLIIAEHIKQPKSIDKYFSFKYLLCTNRSCIMI